MHGAGLPRGRAASRPRSAGASTPGARSRALAGQADATASGERAASTGSPPGSGPRGATVVDRSTRCARLGGDAAAALDELLVDYGWRSLRHRPDEPTLAERPGGDRRRGSAARSPAGTARSARSGAGLRRAARSRCRATTGRGSTTSSPWPGRPTASTTTTPSCLFAMPLGLVRRAVLEVGRRLAARGRIEARRPTRSRPSRRRAGARSSRRGPAAARARRAAAPSAGPRPTRHRRRWSASRLPTEPLRSSAAHTAGLDAMLARCVVGSAWVAARPDPDRAAATVGERRRAGHGRSSAADPADALAPAWNRATCWWRVTTHAAYNTIFPLAGGRGRGARRAR